MKEEFVEEQADEAHTSLDAGLRNCQAIVANYRAMLNGAGTLAAAANDSEEIDPTAQDLG